MRERQFLKLRTCLTAAAVAIIAIHASTSSAAGPTDPDIREILQPLDKDDDDIVIKVEELPQVIRDYIAKDMPDAKITEARKDFKGNQEKKGKNFTYEVDVKDGKKEYEFRFSPDGELLKKRENAGDDVEQKSNSQEQAFELNLFALGVREKEFWIELNLTPK